MFKLLYSYEMDGYLTALLALIFVRTHLISHSIYLIYMKDFSCNVCCRLCFITTLFGSNQNESLAQDIIFAT